MQAARRKRLHLAPELLSKRPEAMHLMRSTAQCFWQQHYAQAAHAVLTYSWCAA